MKCPRCQHPNDESASFCEECGARVGGQACRVCNAALSPSAKFCPSCGTQVVPTAGAGPGRQPRVYTPKHLTDKILQSRSALEGERKQVTVLFADVKGSMELAEQLDPEEWHRVLDRFFQILTDGVHRFEGTVNQYTGDGIMALFGAPIAHEDHAQRACYAALSMSEELRRYGQQLRREQGLSFSTRLGLNSGEVVVGRIGDDLRMDYTARGHTVGLAARMEELAEPGKIYLTEDTAALVSGFFELEDLGAFEIRGVHDDVRVHALQGTGRFRTRLEVSRARGFSRLVGRADEMQALDTAWAHALKGEGRVVGVVGEAGVGKSRLCAEFVERCRARGFAAYEGHCPAHGKMLPFLPLLELLRNYFGIGERDGDQVAREKIAGRLLLLDGTFGEALPLVFDFLRVPDPERSIPEMDPEVRQRRLFAFVRRLVRARSAREPAVLMLDDLHWIDAASDVFLAQFVEAVDATRTLLLVNFRPEYDADWMGTSHYEQLPLLPLGAEAAVELLGELLGRDPSLGDLAERIRERTGGNPFFIEEVVHSLAESGSLHGQAGEYLLTAPVETVQIPATVQAVLSARIDRLGEREKQLLQTASVIGKKFPEDVLRHVAELPEPALAESLAVLRTSEFIHEEALYPEREYAFKHPLTQEVTYQSQLRDRRTRIHGDVARAIETVHAERLDEQAALLGQHWEEAGELLAAARCHRRAAVWAGFAHITEALWHWRKVRALLKGTPETAETIDLGLEACGQLLQIGVRSGLAEENPDELLAEGDALAERSGNQRGRLLLRLGYGLHCLYGVGRMPQAVDALRECARLADRSDDATLGMAARFYLSNALVGAGPLDEGLAVIDEFLELRRNHPGLDQEILGYDLHMGILAWRSWFLAAMGRVTEAVEEMQRATELGRRSGYPLSRAVVGAVCSFASWQAGDAAAGLEHAQRAVEMAEAYGVGNIRALAQLALGYAYAMQGRWREAIEATERALESPVATFRAVGMAELATAWLALGDLGRARSFAEEALSLSRSSGSRIAEADAWLCRAQVSLRSEGARQQSRIERCIAHTLELAEETGYRIIVPRVHELRGELMQALGDATTRDSELREARRLFTAMGATGHAARLEGELQRTMST